MAVVEDLAGEPVDLAGWVNDADVTVRQRAFLLPLTGLVSVCDWIASDTAGPASFLNTAPVTVLHSDGPVAYGRARADQAVVAVSVVFSGRPQQPRTPVGDFTELFHGRKPRGVQNWITDADHGPGLVLLTAGMGEGKTEAGLFRHVFDLNRPAWGGASDDLYFGLPTMATADAMMARVRDFWDGTAAPGHLAHSQAILSDFYAPTATVPGGVCDHDDSDHGAASGLTAADWFQGRHRALLAPVTVGTQDQVLAAALRHKYVTVRHAGLAGKHLILDEIHTYDAYQHQLLIRLLEWLGAYRCRVTLMSATLPRQRVVELVTAYWSGWHGLPTATARKAVADAIPNPLPYPSVTTVDGTGTVPAVVHRQKAWRRFTLHAVAHPIPAGDRDARALYPARIAKIVTDVRAGQPDVRIGVIVNTLDRAINVYRALRTDSRHGQAVVLHSRMVSAQRTDRTDQVHRLVGERAPAGPVLVVATQVAEASLDLDFDVLVTDLAPIAALWQRSGRMWRHSVNTGTGWTHPDYLTYREAMTGPFLHVVVPVDDKGQFTGQAALPYLAAELRRAWEHPDCLARGARTSFEAPGDMQASVDAGNVTWNDLVAGLDTDSDETRDVMAALGAQTAEQAAAGRGELRLADAAESPWDDVDTPVCRFGPDWSDLTSDALWRGDAVTRLQDREQARIVVCDPTGATTWAWRGQPAALADPSLNRNTLLAALAAVVPVSGSLARKAREMFDAVRPPTWEVSAPVLLRDTYPLTVADLATFAVLDPDLGLIRTETP